MVHGKLRVTDAYFHYDPPNFCVKGIRDHWLVHIKRNGATWNSFLYGEKQLPECWKKSVSTFPKESSVRSNVWYKKDLKNKSAKYMIQIIQATIHICV